VNFRLSSLALQFRRSLEIIDLSASITFFHGRISSGKSTILHMIDACLGGKFPSNPAIKQEFLSARLEAQIGENQVLFEREAGSNQVQVTWRDPSGAGAAVLAPIDNGEVPIWGENIFGLSDLIFELAGIGPMKVRRNKSDPDAPLIPLSFRDVMWYCYLDQDRLDSTFFHLENDDNRMPKSRDVMRFILGYYTDRLNQLDQSLAHEVEQAATKRESAKQLEKLLSDLGYDSALEIAAAIQRLEQSLTEAKGNLEALRETHEAHSHFSDDLRQKLRELSTEIEARRNALFDADELIQTERELRAELLSAKFRLKRLESASSILASVDFESCPRCGTGLEFLQHKDGQCVLCGASEAGTQPEPRAKMNADQTDLDSRLAEIEESLKFRIRIKRRQVRNLDEMVGRKASADAQLTEEMRNYDSAFLSQARALERQIASLQQELSTLHRDARIPEALKQMQREADAHTAKAAELRREIESERKKLASNDQLVSVLEAYFFEALRAAHYPSLTDRDTIFVNRRNWMAYICPDGNESIQYDFHGASSGGKKTLFKVCYAIALHRLSEKFSLPLPLLLMIDSPMKNIGNDVNKDIFLSLHKYIYVLSTSDLSRTQLIIADTDMASAPSGVDVRDRLMIAGDLDHPPLIPYYSGH
jgi:hypothetical protein